MNPLWDWVLETLERARYAAVLLVAAGVLLCGERAAAQDVAPAPDDEVMSVMPYVGFGALSGAVDGLIGTGFYCAAEDCTTFLTPQPFPFLLGAMAGVLVGGNVGLLVADTVALVEGRSISVLASVVSMLLGAGLLALGIGYTVEGQTPLAATIPVMAVGAAQLGLGVWHLARRPGEP